MTNFILNLNKNIQYFVVICIFFLFIYAPRLSSPVYINTSIFIFCILFSKYYRKSLQLVKNKNLLILSLFLSFLTFYNFAISLFYNNNPIYFSTILISNIIYLIFGIMIKFYTQKNQHNLYNLTIYFFRIILTIIIVNSIIIIIETISPNFKISIESILFNDYSNESIIQYADHPFWKRGFASAGGASQSLFSAFGVLICFFLYQNKKLSFFGSVSSILIILSAIIFIGRTGIILSIFYILIFIAYVFSNFIFNRKIQILKIIFTILFFSISFAYIIKQIEFDQGHLNWAFDWFDTNNGFVENQSFEGAKNHIYLPDNPIHLLFGKGFFEGEDSDYPRSDSGYIKTILSVGIILTFAFYFLIFYIFFKLALLEKKMRFFFIFLVITLLITEFKEPFVYQNFLGRVIFSYFGFILFTNKQNNLIENIAFNK